MICQSRTDASFTSCLFRRIFSFQSGLWKVCDAWSERERLISCPTNSFVAESVWLRSLSCWIFLKLGEPWGLFFQLQSQMISSLATNNPPTLQQQTVLGGCWKDEEMHQQLKIYHISVSKCLKLPDLHYIFCLVVYLHHPNRFKQCSKFTQYNGEFHLVACRQMKLTVIFFWSAVFLRLHSCSDPIPWVSFTLCVWKCCYFHY